LICPALRSSRLDKQVFGAAHVSIKVVKGCNVAIIKVYPPTRPGHLERALGT